MLSLWTFLQVARKWYCISLVVLFFADTLDILDY